MTLKLHKHVVNGYMGSSFQDWKTDDLFLEFAFQDGLLGCPRKLGSMVRISGL